MGTGTRVGVEFRRPTEGEVRGLLTPRSGPCVSIYLPTHRRHPEWKQDPVRFRGLLGQASELLRVEVGPSAVDGLLGPLERWGAESHWEYGREGLAVLRSPDLAAAYRLPMAVPELAVVAPSFHVKPLIRFLTGERRFFVLSVSQNAVTLYEGGADGATVVPLDGVPTSLREALGVPDFDRSRATVGGGAAGYIHHGQGPGAERTKEWLLSYFRKIDRGLHAFLREETAPLLLAAVGYYHPIYREVNRYPHFMADGIEGNFEKDSAGLIHERAWPLVRRRFDARVRTWSERYRDALGTGLASERLEEVAASTIAGRVRCLLVEARRPIWGILDRATGAVHRHDRQQGPQDADLLDDIAEEAWKRGAELFVLPREAMPVEGPIAALYRF